MSSVLEMWRFAWNEECKVRIASTPWEFIWLLSLLVFIISLMWGLIRQVRRRKLAFPKSPFFYGSLLLIIVIPLGLQLTDHRFKLGDGASEATRLDHEIPDLVIREYTGYSIRQVYEASLRVMQSARTYGQPWTVTFADVMEFRAARLEALVPALVFEDHLTITIQLIPSQPGLHVIAFSRSSTGQRDFGENARHIKQFYEALDAELAGSQ